MRITFVSLVLVEGLQMDCGTLITRYIHDADIQSTFYSHLMEEYCTHQQTMPCTRRSPACLGGRIPPDEASLA